MSSRWEMKIFLALFLALPLPAQSICAGSSVWVIVQLHTHVFIRAPPPRCPLWVRSGSPKVYCHICKMCHCQSQHKKKHTHTYCIWLLANYLSILIFFILNLTQYAWKVQNTVFCHFTTIRMIIRDLPTRSIHHPLVCSSLKKLKKRCFLGWISKT